MLKLHIDVYLKVPIARSVLDQDTSEPQSRTDEKDMNSVSCRNDITEILLKAA